MSNPACVRACKLYRLLSQTDPLMWKSPVDIEKVKRSRDWMNERKGKKVKENVRSLSFHIISDLDLIITTIYKFILSQDWFPSITSLDEKSQRYYSVWFSPLWQDLNLVLVSGLALSSNLYRDIYLYFINSSQAFEHIGPTQRYWQLCCSCNSNNFRRCAAIEL